MSHCKLQWCEKYFIRQDVLKGFSPLAPTHTRADVKRSVTGCYTTVGFRRDVDMPSGFSGRLEISFRNPKVHTKHMRVQHK